ncbi:MAG: endopeptidase La [Gammaproteobacteria bacterium]
MFEHDKASINIPGITEPVDRLPVLPLRDVVVSPNMVIPLFVGREKSVKALEAAMRSDKQVLLLAQRDPAIDDPLWKDLYEVGACANILQLLKLPDGTLKVLVEGAERAKVIEQFSTGEYMEARYEILPSVTGNSIETEVLTRSVLNEFENYVKLNKKIPPEILSSLASIEEPGRLADTISAHMPLKIDEKQLILETLAVDLRLEKLLVFLEKALDLLEVEKRIRVQVKGQMEKTQREYFLKEQMQAIQKELSELDDMPNETEALARKIEEVGMSEEAKTKALAELNKLKMMSPMSAEATVTRNYLDWMLQVPWKSASVLTYNLIQAEKILNEDHYGLEKVKERIIEHLAVEGRLHSLSTKASKKKGKLAKKLEEEHPVAKMKQYSPILCLVGPPGVGKTSLGESIARATGRKFVRISLGGVRDEAEIRGHRRTYIGSMPGKILQKLAKVGVRNPLFLLDEIDKMASDFRGDPAAALLEVLDPEQNNTFSDHYLEVDYDLSDVMFIATSNSLNIPEALLDRMEVIRLAGYTEDEKMNIALNYLLPKQIKNNGLSDHEIQVTDAAIRDIIREYTREAGVRGLEREISKICRKIVKQNAIKPKEAKTIVTPRNLEKFLGVAKYRFDVMHEDDRVGQVNGLAWTSVGGEMLTIEAASSPGKGKVTRTGQLGEVMQESIQAAFTVIRNRSQALGVAPDFYEKMDMHVHVPEGATPKDGPSAGIGMCTAMVSALTGIPVHADVAMTGEITLRGEVLPIGGLKEKLLAARRSGIKTVIIPIENERDLKEIPKNVLEDLKIVPVRWIDQVLDIALLHPPVPRELQPVVPAVAALAEKPEEDAVRKH